MNLLICHDLLSFAAPVRIERLTLDEMHRNLFNPLRLNLSCLRRKDLRGFYLLPCHNPFRIGPCEY